MKNDSNISKIHKNHGIEDLIDLMPSVNEIKKIQNRINNYDKLLNSIEKWQKTLFGKIEKLKSNLLSEKELLTKIIKYFNPFFLNYNYFKNFQYLKEYTKHFNNKYLDDFFKADNFEEQTKILSNYFTSNNKVEKEILIKYGKFKYFSEAKGFVEKINDNCFLKYSTFSNKIDIFHYNKNSDSFINEVPIPFNTKIDSVSYSKELNKIFVCLLNENIIKIIDYDEKNNILKLSNQDISEENNINRRGFIKCIGLDNGFIVTANPFYISIWEYKKKSKNYENIDFIKLESEISNLLSINNDSFIASQPYDKTILFFNYNKLDNFEIVMNVDSMNSQDCLFKYNNYIIVNCNKGIAFISIKNKELIQYMENFYDRSFFKEICICSNGKLLILYINKYSLPDDNTSFDEFSITPINKKNKEE